MKSRSTKDEIQIQTNFSSRQFVSRRQSRSFVAFALYIRWWRNHFPVCFCPLYFPDCESRFSFVDRCRSCIPVEVQVWGFGWNLGCVWWAQFRSRRHRTGNKSFAIGLQLLVSSYNKHDSGTVTVSMSEINKPKNKDFVECPSSSVKSILKCTSARGLWL